MAKTPDLKSSLLSIAYNAAAVGAARDRAESILAAIKPRLIGLRLQGGSGSRKGLYEVTHVDLSVDCEVLLFGRKVTGSGKLGLLTRPLGEATARKLGL